MSCVCMHVCCVCVWHAAGGFAWLSHIFKLCTAMTNLGNVAALKDWLSETYFNLAMGTFVVLRQDVLAEHAGS